MTDKVKNTSIPVAQAWKVASLSKLTIATPKGPKLIGELANLPLTETESGYDFVSIHSEYSKKTEELNVTRRAPKLGQTEPVDDPAVIECGLALHLLEELFNDKKKVQDEAKAQAKKQDEAKALLVRINAIEEEEKLAELKAMKPEERGALKQRLISN